MADRRRWADLAGLSPFLLYVAIFLGAPTVVLAVGAFRGPDGWTLENLHAAFTGVYGDAFVVSTELSLISAVISAVVGLAVAFVIAAAPEEGPLRQVVSTASGVLANFGGVPLAFAFIAAFGPVGMVTRWLSTNGVDISSFSLHLFDLSGLVVVYLYFQIPLMVLVILPALEGLRPQWVEAARSLGSSRWQYWRLVGGPLLFPPFAGALLLLFANSFASYATAAALTSGSIPLVPIQIGQVMSGNVAAGQENVGKALGLGAIVLVALAMGGYGWAQRKTTRWLR
ncbi:ABC transporter permease [Kribbella antibiotica]|uniref:ABC transporter permease n=1 Tax=Kribbella antibiotica TaxID=190195 RepID=UPI00192D58E4|nr:ABC transporter permease subunit [Kribbella antibiotica]